MSTEVTTPRAGRERGSGSPTKAVSRHSALLQLKKQYEEKNKASVGTQAIADV